MSDDVEVIVNEAPATALSVASPAEETQIQSDVAISEVAEKMIPQSQVDEIVKAEKAKAEAKADRRALKAYRETLERVIPQKTEERPQETPAAAPKLEEFENFHQYEQAKEAYLTDKITKEIRQGIGKQSQADTAQQEQQALETAFWQKAEKVKDEFPDFEETIGELKGRLTPIMYRAALEADNSPKLLYHLSTHPEEAAKIAQMSPVRQAAAILKLDETVGVTKTTAAPTPPAQVGNRGTLATNDPGKMNQAQYNEWRVKNGKPRWAK